MVKFYFLKTFMRLVFFILSLINFVEVLCKALYLSVDPYMRPYSSTLPIGSTMLGEQLAEYEEY